MGAVVGERAYARWELKERLVQDAMPRVTAKSHTEIIDLPARGKEAIRTWFHGKCLKSATFKPIQGAVGLKLHRLHQWDIRIPRPALAAGAM